MIHPGGEASLVLSGLSEGLDLNPNRNKAAPPPDRGHGVPAGGLASVTGLWKAQRPPPPSLGRAMAPLRALNRHSCLL
ncbi:hypothetical protein NL676_016154 [Syzygium grande]|nr:hypothetical protein NL676_016154 [Syzygium grande]